MICDNAKKMIQGEFNRKLKQASCHLRQTEPFTSWSNECKRKVKELKKGSEWKKIKTRTPNRLWDDCPEFEAQISSKTMHSIYKLDGEVPETIMSGETSGLILIYQTCR